MTLVWGVRKEGTDKDRNRARYLFQQLDVEEAQVVVPAVALAECLVPVAHEDRARVVATLSERFRIVPFDARSSAVAAKLFRDFKPQRKLGEPGKRDILKADAMIVASALTAGAQVFYSDDRECRAMAESLIAARSLPDMPSDLFNY